MPEAGWGSGGGAEEGGVLMEGAWGECVTPGRGGGG